MDALDVFCDVIELPVGERAAAIERMCRDEPEVRREVEELLRHHERPATMLQTRHHRVDVSTLLPERAASSTTDDEPAAPPRWRRRATIVCCVTALVAVAGIAALRSLRASWRQAEQAERALRAARTAADHDPATAKRQLERVSNELRDASWHELHRRLDPVVAALRAAQVEGIDAFDGDVAFLDDARACVAFTAGNHVRLLDVTSGATIHSFVADTAVHGPRIDARAGVLCAWAPVEHHSTCELYVWDIGSGAELERLRMGAPAIDDVRFAADSDTLLCELGGRRVRVALRTGAQRALRRSPRLHEVASISARWWVTIADDGGVRLRDAEQSRHRLLGRHLGALRAAAFSMDERWLATSGDDECVRIWSIGDPLAARAIPRRAARVALSADGGALLTLDGEEAALLRFR